MGLFGKAAAAVAAVACLAGAWLATQPPLGSTPLPEGSRTHVVSELLRGFHISARDEEALAAFTSTLARGDSALAGKTVIVTGATRGLGRGIATALLAGGLWWASQAFDWLALRHQPFERVGLLLACLVGAVVIYFGTLLATGLNLKATLKR